MPLSKQLHVLISTLFLLILTLNLILSIKNIKDYLQGEAKIHAQNTATSLGLLLTDSLEQIWDAANEALANQIDTVLLAENVHSAKDRDTLKNMSVLWTSL
ncbi:MAG: LapD/MoxY N-terminal periplasmic domain-containing protein [Methylomonas lenta]|nr:LapD/MoxY N-terminal periplasmic domain-containing protein [Methylomonas lenta]